MSYCRNIDTDAIWDTLDMQPSKLSEGKIVCVNQENGCDKRDENVLKEMILTKSIITY